MSIQDKMTPIHPFCAASGPMHYEVADAIAEDMKINGFDPRFPIILFKKETLDGRHREFGALKAGVEPIYKNFTGTEDEARQFVDRVILNRRHESQFVLTQIRATRIQHVRQLKLDGMSLRAIAEKVGRSPTQVRKDLEDFDANGEAAGAHGVHTSGNGEEAKAEPAEVKGRDGKSYPARRPKKKVDEDAKPTASAADPGEAAAAVCEQEAPAVPEKTDAEKGKDAMGVVIRSLQRMKEYKNYVTHAQDLYKVFTDRIKTDKKAAKTEE